MKAFLGRFFIYIAILVLMATIFDAWYKCGPYSLADCAVQAIGYYVVGWGLWMLIFEGVFRLARFIGRRVAGTNQKQLPIEDLATKGLDVPETNKLDRK